jgi:hypothetical protein
MSRASSRTPQPGESSRPSDSSDHGRFFFRTRARTSENFSSRRSDVLSQELSFSNGPVERLFTSNSRDESSFGLNITPPTRTRSVSDDWRHRGDETKPRVVHDPPRPPMEGYEWVWFPEGYWAERQRLKLGRPGSGSKFRLQWKRKSPASGKKTIGPQSSREAAEFGSMQESSEFPLPQSAAVASSSKKDAQCGTGEPGNSSKILRGIQYILPTYPHFVSPTGEPEGLYRKAKRGIGKGLIRKRKKVCPDNGWRCIV